MRQTDTLSRRAFLASVAAAGAAALLRPRRAAAYPGPAGARPGPLVTHAIPSSGQPLPLVGLGSWATFNVGEDTAARDACAAVMRAFFAEGGRLIDCSPMYGSSQEVIGYGLAKLGHPKPLDFVQFTYNAVDRDVEQRLLPLAQERKMAVICNRPFQGGDLIHRVERTPLPPWAAEIDCANWPQVLLKFIVSHPAVTCAIPATSQVAHVRENVGASYGRLPDAAMRRRIADEVAKL